MSLNNPTQIRTAAYLALVITCLTVGPIRGDDWAISGNNTTVSGGTNVGIGTTLPTGTLDVRGTSLLYGKTVVTGNTAGEESFVAKQNMATGDIAHFRNIDGTVVVVSNAGRVGIGTSSPGYMLDVIGNARFSSTLTAEGTVIIGKNANEDRNVILNSNPGYTKDIRFMSAEASRWGIAVAGIPETGGNAGSPFRIAAYSDAGSQIDIPLEIARASGGNISMSRPVMLASSLGVAGPVTMSTLNLGGNLIYSGNFSIRAATTDGNDNRYAGILGGGDWSVERGGLIAAYGNDIPTYGGWVDLSAGNVPTGRINFYTQNILRYSIDNSGLHKFESPVSMSSPVTVSGTTTLKGVVIIGQNANEDRNVIVNSNPGYSKDIRFMSAEASRWGLAVAGTPETGGNAGSPFRIAAYSDGGTQIDIPLEIDRASGGNISMSRPVMLTSTLGVAGNLNMNGANNWSGFRINVNSGEIATNNGWGISTFGQGNPGEPHTGFVRFRHNGSDDARIEVGRTGSGIFRGFRIYTSEIERYRVTDAGAHTLTGPVKITGRLENHDEIESFRASPSNPILLGRTESDSKARFQLNADGRIAWGSGNENRDVNLYREGQGVLKTDNSLFVAGNVGIGTVSTPEARLHVNGDATVNGNLRANILIAGTVKATAWEIAEAPDYVFERNYELATLEKVESFVKRNKHLPDVPSAKQMKQEGLDLVKMNFRLLKKVEELTLYAIEQNKRSQAHEKRSLELEKEILDLKKSLATISKVGK